MAINEGKKWEEKFREDFRNTFPESTVIRIPDQQSMYKGGSKNPCDFICFNSPKLFMVECKSHKGNTFPFSSFPQYDLLIEYKNKKDVCPYVIIWYIEHSRVIAVSIKEVEKMKKDGLKSINITKLKEEVYNIIEIPCVVKRKYPTCDYSVLLKEELKSDK